MNTTPTAGLVVQQTRRIKKPGLKNVFKSSDSEECDEAGWIPNIGHQENVEEMECDRSNTAFMHGRQNNMEKVSALIATVSVANNIMMERIKRILLDTCLNRSSVV